MLAHEFGHSIDGGKSIPTLMPSGDNDSLDYRIAYRKFLSCIENHYAKDPQQKFVSADDVANQAKLGLPVLERKLQRLTALPRKHALEIAKLRDLIAFGKRFISVQNLSNDKMNGDVESELVADYFFSSAIAQRLQKIPLEKRVNFMIKSFPMFCDSKVTDPDVELLTGGLDMGHPPQKFRIENAFRNPEIREAIGCEPLQTQDPPWCTLEGK